MMARFYYITEEDGVKRYSIYSLLATRVVISYLFSRVRYTRFVWKYIYIWHKEPDHKKSTAIDHSLIRVCKRCVLCVCKIISYTPVGAANWF